MYCNKSCVYLNNLLAEWIMQNRNIIIFESPISCRKKTNAVGIESKGDLTKKPAIPSIVKARFAY